MPIKSGKLTPKERVFAEKYAVTGDRAYSAAKAGYAKISADQAATRPAVQAEIRRVQERRLEALLEKAVDVLGDILATGTERGKLMAVKIVVDKTIGLPGSAGEVKEAHEMTGDEIAAALARLRQEMDARAANARDITPSIEVESASVFD